MTDINPIAVAAILNGKVDRELLPKRPEDIRVHLLEIHVAPRQMEENGSAPILGIRTNDHISRIYVDAVDEDAVYLVSCQRRESNGTQYDTRCKSLFQFHHFPPQSSQSSSNIRYNSSSSDFDIGGGEVGVGVGSGSGFGGGAFGSLTVTKSIMQLSASFVSAMWLS